MSISDGYWADLERGPLQVISVGPSVESIIWHSVDGDGVNKVLRSFWIGELKGNHEWEVKAREGYEVEPEGREKGLENAIKDACACVLQVSFAKVKVDIFRLFVYELL